MKPTTRILCPSCDEQCGKEYNPIYGGDGVPCDPGFREGKGEEFVLPDGRWCCSQFCLDAMLGKFDEE